MCVGGGHMCSVVQNTIERIENLFGDFTTYGCCNINLIFIIFILFEVVAIYKVYFIFGNN